jgi:hypothetical protein
MYLSAERMAIANRAVQETFEQTSIAWQAIPHWEIGDPGATRVRNDKPSAPSFIPLVLLDRAFQLTVVQADAPTPDLLLAEVMSETALLARAVDEAILPALRAAAPAPDLTIAATLLPQQILDQLIPARARVEDAGYRAPSCVLTNTPGLIKLSQLDGGYSVLDSLLAAANVNSLHRATMIDANAAANKKVRIVFLGRRQRIAHGYAAEASPGEEPVDLAVSVLPSLEVIGPAANNRIDVAVRIRFATRIKDASGIVVLKET